MPIIELIVGLAERAKRPAFHENIKLTEGIPTTEPYSKLGDSTALSNTLYIQYFVVILAPLLWLYFFELLLLGVFAVLRKATISFIMALFLSIRPSVRIEQLGFP